MDKTLCFYDLIMLRSPSKHVVPMLDNPGKNSEFHRTKFLHNPWKQHAMLAAFRSRNSIEVECVHGQGVIFILHMGYKSIGKKEVQLSDSNNHIARGWRGIFFFFGAIEWTALQTWIYIYRALQRRTAALLMSMEDHRFTGKIWRSKYPKLSVVEALKKWIETTSLRCATVCMSACYSCRIRGQISIIVLMRWVDKLV